jgi:hypothetical protein
METHGVAGGVDHAAENVCVVHNGRPCGIGHPALKLRGDAGDTGQQQANRGGKSHRDGNGLIRQLSLSLEFGRRVVVIMTVRSSRTRASSDGTARG